MARVAARQGAQSPVLMMGGCVALHGPAMGLPAVRKPTTRQAQPVMTEIFAATASSVTVPLSVGMGRQLSATTIQEFAVRIVPATGPTHARSAILTRAPPVTMETSAPMEKLAAEQAVAQEEPPSSVKMIQVFAARIGLATAPTRARLRIRIQTPAATIPTHAPTPMLAMGLALAQEQL